jgi:5-oxoprolinase (ATP-hydrolysing)
MTATVLSSHRITRAFGLNGGGAGATGENLIERRDGSVEPLKGNDEAEMKPGDVFVIRSPGGGAFGRADQR